MRSYFQSQDYEKISELLENLIVEHNDTPILLISGLRLSWIERSSIPNWGKYLIQIRAILHEQGYNTKSVLQGLDS